MTLNWSAEVDATITRMVNDNISLTKIAAALNMHRRTLTDRADYLGLSRPTGTNDWSDAKSEELKRLWDLNWSSRTIAAALGVSKNAVIGRAHRLGLEPRKKIIAAERKPRKPRAPRKRRHAPHKIDAFGKPTAPVAFVPREANVKPRHLTFEEISPGDGLCRQSYGNDAPFTYCGHPAQDRSSYCPVHHAINYIPWRPRMDREEFERNRLENFRAYKAELVEA